MGLSARSRPPSGRAVFSSLTPIPNTNSPACSASDRFGDDLDGFAYLWRSRYDADTRLCELWMTFFVAEGALYRRSEERHVQRAFRPAEVVAALTESGFVVDRTSDDYTDKACSATTQRMTWVARLE